MARMASLCLRPGSEFWSMIMLLMPPAGGLIPGRLGGALSNAVCKLVVRLLVGRSDVCLLLGCLEGLALANRAAFRTSFGMASWWSHEPTVLRF